MNGLRRTGGVAGFVVAATVVIGLGMFATLGLRSDLIPRALSYLGVVMAVAGLVTIVPALEMVGAVFGLGLIVWFAWHAILMLREPSAAVPAGRSTSTS